MNPEKLRQLGLAVVDVETQALTALRNRIDEQFVHACELLLACQGRVVVTGMGKSGHIAGKIAATLASTGTPAFFVHPGEASHGDLGMIVKGDLVIALSYSGETAELLTIVPLIKRLGVPLITLTGAGKSSLAQQADINLDISVDKEACPLGLAPTASTTASLVMGDALAIALLESRGFTMEDFARSHPGGALGRRLLCHVSDVMATGDAIPQVTPDTSFSDALMEMTRKSLGMTAIVDDNNKLLGVFTDGDLRRSLNSAIDIHNTRIAEVMTSPCKSARANMLTAEIVKLMEQYKINSLPVVDEDHRLIGALNMYTLLRAGVV